MMTNRPATELKPGMTLYRGESDNCNCVIKSVTNATPTSLIVQTDRGRFVFRKTDNVKAGYRY